MLRLPTRVVLELDDVVQYRGVAIERPAPREYHVTAPSLNQRQVAWSVRWLCE